MEWGLKAVDASRVLGDLWMRSAQQGIVWVPEEVTNYDSAMLTMALRLLRGEEEVELYIDTCTGHSQSFEPCKELLWRRENGKQTTGFVGGQAISIGLSYIAVCTRRIATPDSEFLVHGEPLRDAQKLDSGEYLEDHYAADWLSRFTPRSYEEWLETVRPGRHVKFGAEQALEWGVIDEIREVV
jgi:ATP-dependent protease ClpP protease subunit